MILSSFKNKSCQSLFFALIISLFASPLLLAREGIRVDGARVTVETGTLKAVLEEGALLSLVRASDGREFISPDNVDSLPLKLVYPGNEAVSLGEAPNDLVTCLPVNPQRVDIRIESWYGDGVITVGYDPANGDLLIEPSAFASRPGLRACRYTVSGLAGELELIAPITQGIQLPLEDPFIQEQRFDWPRNWEAGMAILQGETGGIWVHCRDTRYRYKSLQVGSEKHPRSIGLDTESYGPLDNKLGAGNLVWRINVYEGDWQEPAELYRDWLGEAYFLEEVIRPDWVRDLQLAVSWCPCDMDMLHALAKAVDPPRVLLHIPQWRTDRYDQNYPTFKASEKGAAFIREAQRLGFRVMPHANSIDMDPLHPVYHTIRDFQYRSLETRQVEGWAYKRKRYPVPESNAARLRYRDYNTMVKVHPGLSMWRSILVENVMAAADELDLELIFLDVTLNTRNLHNSLVENTTSTEGMKMLTAQVAASGKGLLVGGEGRNEITMQDQFIAQGHIFRSSHRNVAGLERVRFLPLNEFMFGRWCRTMGYANIGGRSPEEEMRMNIHLQQGAVPTITVRTADDIENPNPMVEKMLKMAEK